MNLKNLLAILVLSLPTLTTAQTLRVVQLPPNQSVISLGTKPPVEYRLSPSGDAVSVTLVRFGIYPLWPLTVADIGEMRVTRGNGSVLTRTAPTKRDASALDLTISNSFSIGNLAEEAFLLNITPRSGRPEGVVVVKLEEIVSIGEKTRAIAVLLGNERFTVAIRFPATEFRPAIQREGVPPNENLTIRFATEQEKTYQLETTSFFSSWSSAGSVVGGTGAEARITLPVTYNQQPHFFRVKVTAKVVANLPPPTQQPPVQPTPPLPSGPVGFGYSGGLAPGQSGFGYP